MLYLYLQRLEHIIDNLLVVRQVGLEPLQRLCLVIISACIDEALKLFELLIGHLIGKLRTNAKLQRLVDMLQHRLLLVVW